jgi:hypothetical protein
MIDSFRTVFSFAASRRFTEFDVFAPVFTDTFIGNYQLSYTFVP